MATINQTDGKEEDVKEEGEEGGDGEGEGGGYGEGGRRGEERMVTNHWTTHRGDK